MRLPRALLPALLSLAGCDICPLGQTRGPDGVCGATIEIDAGAAPPPIACWAPEAPDRPTLAAARPDGPLRTTACVGLAHHPAFHHRPACVPSDPQAPRDGVDNDCDGMIDERPDGEGGYPAPPPIPKSSIYSLGARRHLAEAATADCGDGPRCAAPVAALGYRCTAAGPMLDAAITLLPRRDDTCLATPGPPICGLAAAHAHLARAITACDAAAHTVQLTWDGARLTLDRLESSDPREPPRFPVGAFITDLDAALACVAAAVAEVNRFADPGDADADGRPDGCDNCPGVANPAQADRDRDRDGMGDGCDACPDLAGAGHRPTDTDADGRPDDCDPDADGDGWPDPCGQDGGRRLLTAADDPPPPSMARRMWQAGGAEAMWCAADRDGDRIPDPEDNCRARANPEQADADDDGVGDACCADDDPDDDGVGNCHYLPPMLRAGIAEQAGAPTEVGPHWDPMLPVPGEATCDPEGRRTCWPAGTWRGELSAAEVAADVRARVAPDLPFVQRVGPTDTAVALCNETFRAHFGVAAPWPEALWRRCIVDAGGELRAPPPADPPPADPPADPPPARPIEFDLDFADGTGVSIRFGLHGQRVIWWLGGYWRRDEYCDYDVPFRVERRGVERHGSVDIFCRSEVLFDAAGMPAEGTPGEVLEIKWFRTDVDTWALGRVRKFIDQAERLWLIWQNRSAQDPWLRYIYMFGWQPPPIARHILEHDFNWPDPWQGEGPLYAPLREVAPASGISDRLTPAPMLAGRVYWTRFVPTDFAFIDGILDEAPCVVCSERPELCGSTEPRMALNIAGCEFTADGVECGVDGELVEIRLTEATDVYVNLEVLKKWAGLYQAWCIQGRALGCNERLSRLYDDLKCTGW